MNPTRTQLLAQEIQEIVSWAKNLNFDVPTKILVNGASGFLGQWVFAVLHQIASIFPNLEVFAKTSRLKSLEATWSPVLNGKINRFDQVNADFDIIFDFALPPTGPTIQEQISQSKHFYKNILECASMIKVGGRIVHPSSGAAYGSLRYSSELCEDTTLVPSDLSIYGETKLEIEKLAFTFESAGTELITPRIFSVFGPLMREDSPLIGNTFLREAAKRRDFEARQSINVFRDFIFVTDLVKQLVVIGTRKTEVNNINLGSYNRLDIATFGNLVAQSAGVRFTEGLQQEPPDHYFGCLHQLELIQPDLISNCMHVADSIERTLAFYRAE